MCPSFADLSFIIWQSNHPTLHNERERATHKWVSVEIAWARGRWVCPSILRVNCRGWALFLMGCRELSVRDRKRHHSYAWVGWEQHSVNFTAKLPSKSSINLQVGHNSDGNWKKQTSDGIIKPVRNASCNLQWMNRQEYVRHVSVNTGEDWKAEDAQLIVYPCSLIIHPVHF